MTLPNGIVVLQIHVAVFYSVQQPCLPHIQREVGMPQVVELASESEGFSLEHGGLQLAGGFADGRVTANRMADQSASADSPFATSLSWWKAGHSL